MQIHTSRLHPGPFEAVQSGRKTIESRVYDGKRRAFQVGDELVFVSRANPEQTVQATITDLLLCKSFAGLFDSAPLKAFDGESKKALIKEARQFYSVAEEERYGVVGIVFKTV